MSGVLHAGEVWQLRDARRFRPTRARTMTSIPYGKLVPVPMRGADAGGDNESRQAKRQAVEVIKLTGLSHDAVHLDGTVAVNVSMATSTIGVQNITSCGSSQRSAPGSRR